MKTILCGGSKVGTQWLENWDDVVMQLLMVFLTMMVAIKLLEKM